MTARPARAEVVIPLRWCDADAYGHVHHATFLSLAEHARILWFLRVFDSDRPIWDHVNVHLRIDYRAELLVEHGEVVCRFRPLGFGHKSVRLAETMESPRGRVAAELETVLVAWEPAEHRARPLTADERRALQSLTD